MNLPSPTLQGLATTSLLVSLLIVIFLPLRPLLRRVAGSEWLCVLWLAILARLLMPLPLESHLSLFNRWQKGAPPIIAQQEGVKIKVNVIDGASHAATPVDFPAADPVTHPVAAFHFAGILNMLWLAGFAASAAALAWRWRQTRRLAAATLTATDERLLNIFASIPKEWRRGTEIRMSDAVEVPTLAGILHPQIWMPKAWPAQFTDDELRNVLLHELGHARRGDLVVQWLFAIAQCVHWFNPLVWFAGRAARLDREMACDAWVLARNDADHAGYGAALMKTVQLLRNPLRVSQGTIAMASDRRSLHARISGIGAFRPVAAWRGIAATGLIAMALAVATTSRISAQDKSPIPAPSAAPNTVPVPATQIWTPTPTPTPKPVPGGPQVSIKAEFFEISEAEAKKLGFVEISTEKKPDTEVPSVSSKAVLNEASTGELMKKLNKTASVSLLSAPSVTALSGQRAVVEVIREMRYPTEFDTDKKDPQQVVPTAFETRNVGITLEIEPTIGQGGNISLAVAPQVVTFLGYLGYNSAGEGKPAKTPAPGDSSDFFGSSMANMQWPKKGEMFQPIFSSSRVTTSITLTSGQSALLGGLRSEQARGRLLYCLITATIVKPDDAAPAVDAPKKAEIHRLTWKNYDGTGDPARAEFILDDQPLGAGAKGIAALRARIATMPKDSELMIEPYYGDPGSGRKLVYPFDMEALEKEAAAHGVHLEIPQAG